ncbi:TIGR04282 family arsenosugar biosynthesis glycosyltransferase [Anabaena sp. FACHB-1237]|uniref:TIGR04282 family arsenosugar biosynthesis glycosyltransferase n=1 Tax=Anabaena sp. FACHB-1237 TaxID=2692769 RepID=UPI0016813D23|nr:TIGR04282 family arsenosugar biosynthesis glycosyltransferase [Anabaena sp. FACHB-1237]MBD2137758.1 TIGR04282 family arsenosugar biosynthesis glycosyltransferase [Anabaena sp. FACHB-1237]
MKHLIIFTRYPEPGQTKTRLIPALGEIGAANLHKQMTEYTMSQVRELREIIDLSVEIRFTGGNTEKMQEWLGRDLWYQCQGEGDLGVRMKRSLTESFHHKKEQVIIIGTDCPSINYQILASGFQQLNNYDIVIGPAVDGGYYLIGLKKTIPDIFDNIGWGTDQVLKETVKVAKSENLSIAYLPILNDIDRPEDL